MQDIFSLFFIIVLIVVTLKVHYFVLVIWLYIQLFLVKVVQVNLTFCFLGFHGRRHND